MSLPSPSAIWKARYDSGQTPWEADSVRADLKAFLKRRGKGINSPSSGHSRVLILGCGMGQEIKAFADTGCDVTAIDFAEDAVELAGQFVGPGCAARIILGDFFAHRFDSASFDLIYEHAFLCAFPPRLREAYRDRVATLLKHGGDLVGYFYYNKPELDPGPPYGFAWGTSDELFGRHFILLKDLPVQDSLPVFAGRERWQEQRRTAHRSR
jgi:SAM-dependent methyltransferase